MTKEQELRKQTEEAKFEAFASVCKKVAELEKENAELKLKLEALDGQTPWKDIKDKSEVIGQLTKAKEILKTIVDYYPCYNKTIIEQAEQFLKEMEK